MTGRETRQGVHTRLFIGIGYGLVTGGGGGDCTIINGMQRGRKPHAGCVGAVGAVRGDLEMLE